MNTKIIYKALFISLVITQAVMSQQMSFEPGKTVDYNNVKMPESPNAASFAESGNIQVNTATGVPNINIPLYTYELDGVQIPIVLSYNATGVKVSDFATQVGLNWTLSAGGQISRTVRGKTDEFRGWLADFYEPLDDDWYDEYSNDPIAWQEDMVGTYPNDYYDGYAKKNDHMPDWFNYSFLGFQGGYIYERENFNTIKEQKDGLTISGIYNGGYNVTLVADDLQGNSYDFEYADAETSSNETITANENDLTEDFYSWEGHNGFDPITAWKLSQITTKNGFEIDFDYQDETMAYDLGFQQSNITLGSDCDPSSSTLIKTHNRTKINYDYTVKLIKKISSSDSNIEVIFHYFTDGGLPNTVWKTKLTKIEIKDLLTGKVKEFHFVYERFNGDPRLKLTELYEVGYDGSNPIAKPSYEFAYNDGASLPSKSSYAQDFFGYFNNETGNNSLVPNINGLQPPSFQTYFDARSGDRDLNSSFVDRGILTEIKYPTGGKTEFDYEPNEKNGKYMGGLRIEEIKDISETGTFNRRTYQYDSLYGFDLSLNNRYLTYSVDDNTTTYNSSFSDIPGNTLYNYRTGYFYGNVIETTYDDTNSFTREMVYEENLNAYHKFDYVLKSETLKKGSQNVKITEYTYDIVGTPEDIYWNALGTKMCYLDSQTWKFGYNNYPIVVRFTGNYSYRPTRIATTDFLKKGGSLSPVTVVKDITYDPDTQLVLQEVTDFRKTRDASGDYTITDNEADIITVDYTYPWDPSINLPLPGALPMTIEVFSDNHGGKISGQDFEYDSAGNIKVVYEFNKGEGSNSSPLSYVHTDYEKTKSFIFDNGKMVQVIKTNDVPTAYVWGYKYQYPMAKIEGTSRVALNQSIITSIEGATTESALLGFLDNLRNDPSTEDAMVTTYTHLPLVGVSTITDPKGDRITYLYDAFGRLLYVKDKQGNILSENEYNYGN